MKEIQKKIALLAAGLLAGYASAASDVIWNSEGVENETRWDVPYSGVYADNEKGASASADTTNNVINLALTVTAGTTGNVAGYNFGWKQTCTADWKCTDVIVSLASYKGLCLTYKADQKTRMEFNQTSIGDFNYYGVTLPATETVTRTFISFSDLKQEWESKTVVKWDATKQKGLQFGFKNTYAGKGVVTDHVEIYEMVLADECETFAPELVGEAEGSETLNEGDTLKIDLSKIFADKDGDATVSVTPEINKSLVSVLGEKKGLALNSVVKIVPAKANLEGDATILLEAADALHKDTAKYELTITLVNVDNAPVAVNDAFTIEEDGKLVVKPEKSVIFNDYDIDDEEQTYDFIFALVDDVAHGTLTLDENEDGEYLGSFTYVPEENFNGTDFFTYTITDNTGKTSKPGKVTITVTPVNDPLIFTVLDEDFFKKVIELEEDFDPDTVESIAITSAIISLEDADGLGSLKKGVSSKNGIVSATVKELKGTYYINLEPVKDAHGDDVLTLYFKDDVDSVGVSFNVSVAAVADPPVALADKYDVLQDTVNNIDVKIGVLANDYNPDDKTVTLVAVLDKDAAHGKVELAEDGSFTYTTEGYAGEDSFTYHVETEESGSSEPVEVTLNVARRNKAPAVVDSALKALVAKVSEQKEDFSFFKITKAELTALFTDDVTPSTGLKISVRTDDSLTQVIDGATVSIKSVKDVCGDAEVIVSAMDADSLITELALPIKIACVNDRPIASHYMDTLHVALSGWELSFSLDSIFNDVDGDTLTYKISDASDVLSATIEDGVLTIAPATDSTKLEFATYRVKFRAYDKTDSSSAMTFLIVASDAQSVKNIAAAPKATWQNAIAAERGAVSLMDMQGRVMWTRRLPVSESEVRAASAKVQGRKVLRVNSQTYTIK